MRFTELPDVKEFHKKFYLAGKEILDFQARIDKEFFSIGLFLGDEKNPRPSAVELMARNSDKKAFVDDKAEWMFLCGNKVLKKAITKLNAEPGEFVMVQNKRDENLGLGQLDRHGNIKNILDKGIYLREKQ